MPRLRANVYRVLLYDRFAFRPKVARLAARIVVAMLGVEPAPKAPMTMPEAGSRGVFGAGPAAAAVIDVVMVAPVTRAMIACAGVVAVAFALVYARVSVRLSMPAAVGCPVPEG